MDILDQLMKFAQISGSINVQCKLQDAWYIRHERQSCHGIVHIVSQGQGYLHIDGVERVIKLKTNDVVFLPHSLGHSLTHQPNYEGPSKIKTISNGAFTLKQCGGESPDLSLFCANFTYDKQSELFNNLPEVILLNLQDASLKPLLEILQREADGYQAGSENIINALLSVLLTLLIRTYLQQDNAQLNGLLNGLRDKRLYNVISNIIAKPEQNWKIETLCHIANLSRAQLIRLFNQQIGVSPYNFVNHIRLQKAAELLKHSQQSVLSIALNCGFQSESNFGKAFKKYYKFTPGQYRKNK
ncbi:MULTISPECIES: AraC family transcriptional regulator [Rodentibacter]|uniref:AraC family transcriptional regulator n=1 Tax=Rodentibacter TaxID=1960084 RepID=UPI0009851FD5|nr:MULTISPECIES: AraC family transcriptional regulator [Rodentibacter]MCX2962219.1 AraC family transcriptional regulator [Rodentibacter heylii]MDC2825165.1 AraC family transcriptional regulator [Rodentibacter pneumotropicus]OOF60585.1 AraC family transcriptional regulator [Rodentibacter pneumotropicus]THA18214.1 AraC family transcriptional regulator [Rodentibacter pneumotropicus]